MAGFVPTGSTWQLWSDAGFPSSISTPLTGGSRVYKVCSGTDLIDINVSIVLDSIQRIDDFVNTDQRVRFIQSVKAVADVAPPDDDVTVRLQLWFRDEVGTCQNIQDKDFFQFTTVTVTIPQGQTDSNIIANDSYGYWLSYQEQTSPCPIEYDGSFTIAAQGAIPNCNPSSPCTLEITGVTTVDPTFRGGSDGSITVFVSGSTGTTNYSINGGTPQVSNTFTGLPAGSYTVLVEEGDCYDSSGVTLNDGEFRTSDFIVVEPNEYVASENPIVTTISTATNTEPKQAVTSFTFDDGILDNYSVTFNLTSPTAYNATFTAKDFPNRENFFLTKTITDASGIPFGQNSLSEIADSFAEAVQKDINISRWYFVSTSGESVVLTSKQSSASLTLSSANVDILDETGAVATTGITLNVLQDGADAFEGSLVDDYSIYCDIYVGDGNTEFGEILSGGTYFNYTTLELPFNVIDNIHQFDASEVLKTFVTTPKIDFTFTGFTLVNQMIRPFYVVYGEKYPLVANTNTKKKRSKGQTDYSWCFNAALDWEDENTMAEYIGGTIRYLTNSPNPLQIQREQVNFLYFSLVKNVGLPIRLAGDIDFYDGSSQTGITFFNISTGTTNAGGIYALNVSYESLGLEAFENSGNTKIKNVSFVVQIDIGGGNWIDYTQEKTYRFEIDEQPRKFGVAFENKLGGYDTFDFIGEVESSVTRENKTYTVPREILSDGSSPKGFKNNAMFDTKVTKTFSVNTGWINETHFNWLIELLSSNNIYSYTEENQNYLTVTSVNYTKSSLDDLFDITVSFRLTLYENSITV